MNEKLLITLDKILKNNGVLEIISLDMSINSCDLWDLRQYVELKLEQIQLKERLDYVNSKLKESDD